MPEKDVVFNADASTENRHGEHFLTKAGVSFEANASASIDCHGFELSAQAAFAGYAEAKAEAQWIDATIRAKAGASAGLLLKGMLSPNLLDEFGLAIVVKAWARAYVEVLLEIDLKVGELMLMAKDNLIDNEGADSNFLVATVEDFVRGIVIKGAAFAKAEAGFAAHGYLNLTGQLLRREEQGKTIEPGFEITMGGGAAWFAGMSYGAFVELAIPDVTTLIEPTLTQIKARITQRLESVTGESPFLKAVVNNGLDVLIDVSTSFMRPPDQRPDFYEVGWEYGKGVVADLLMEGVQTLFRRTLQLDLYRLLEVDQPDEARKKLSDTIDLILVRLEEFDTVLNNSAASNYVQLIQAFDFIILVLQEELELDTTLLEEIFTAYWTFGVLQEWAGHDTANLAQFDSVRVTLNTRIPDADSALSNGTRSLKDIAKNYWLEFGLETVLFEIFPDVEELIAAIYPNLSSEAATVKFKAVLYELLFDEEPVGDVARRELTPLLIQLMRWTHRTYVKPVVLEQLTALQRAEPALAFFIEQLFVPLVEHADGFIYPSIQMALEQPDGKAAQNLKTVLVSLLYKVIAKSAAATITSLIDYTYTNIHKSCGKLLDSYATRQADGSYHPKSFPNGQDPLDQLAERFHEKLQEEIGGLLGVEQNLPIPLLTVNDATKELLVDLIALGQVIFGPKYYTPQVKADYHQILTSILSLLDKDVFKNIQPDQLAQKATSIAQEWENCQFLPPNTNLLLHSLQRTGRVTIAQFGEVARTVPDILFDYTQKTIETALIEPIRRQVEQAVDALQQEWEDAVQAAKDLMLALQNALCGQLAAWRQQVDLLLERLIDAVVRALDADAWVKLVYDASPIWLPDLDSLRASFDSLFGRNIDQFRRDIRRLLQAVVGQVTNFIDEVLSPLEALCTRLDDHPLWSDLDNNWTGALPLVTSLGYSSLPLQSALTNRLTRSFKQQIKENAIFKSLPTSFAFKAPVLGTTLVVINFSSVENKILDTLQGLYKAAISSVNLNPLFTTINQALSGAKGNRVVLNQQLQQLNQLHGQLENVRQPQTASIDIVHPLALERAFALKSGSAKHLVIYSKNIHAEIRLEGLSPDLLRQPNQRYLVVKVNEKEAPELTRQVTFKGTTAVVTGDIAAYIKPGINSLTCLVVLPNSPAVRKHITFSADPKNYNEQFHSGIVINEQRSNFNAPGNDHYNLEEEYITLENISSQAIDLKDYHVRDAYGHTYKFGAVVLAPQAMVSLHTGTGQDTATSVYWNRKRAVWNNSHDVITLLNPINMVVFEHPYDSGLRWNAVTGRYEQSANPAL